MIYSLTRALHNLHFRQNMMRQSPGGPQSEPPAPIGMPQEPEVMMVSFGKVNGSMGLSIVAAKVSSLYFPMKTCPFKAPGVQVH
jgi:hypothetical protein